MTTPWQHYQADLQGEHFSHDSGQEEAVRQLQDLYERLTRRPETGKSTFSGWLQRLRKEQPEPVVGLYLWGGVGRGKTYLMDTFYECLPFEDKLRTHFHRFMQRVHVELTDFEGEKNPLELIADKLAREARVICFDEFFVTDIGDAMILGGLMEAVFARGVTLVATSIIEAQHLYENGLQ